MSFQTAIIVISYVVQAAIIGWFLYKIFEKQSECELHIAKWTFYSCAVATFVLIFGFRAEIESANPDYPITILFGTAIILCLVICYVQSCWKLQYSKNEIKFTDSFGFKKNFKFTKVQTFATSRRSGLLIDDTYKIKWDSLLMNSSEEIKLFRFFK